MTPEEIAKGISDEDELQNENVVELAVRYELENVRSPENAVEKAEELFKRHGLRIEILDTVAGRNDDIVWIVADVDDRVVRDVQRDGSFELFDRYVVVTIDPYRSTNQWMLE